MFNGYPCGQNFDAVYEYVYIYCQLGLDHWNSLSDTSQYGLDHWMNVNASNLYHRADPQIDGKHPLDQALSLLASCGVTQQDISDWCGGVSPSLVSRWRKGTRTPHKYQWFSIAISIRLPHELLDGFLGIVGCTVDLLCIEDLLLSFALRNGGSRYDVYCLLRKYGCLSAAEMYADVPVRRILKQK